MREFVKKKMPYVAMETDALAAWLQRQAKEGLHLRSTGAGRMVAFLITTIIMQAEKGRAWYFRG